ncbi:ACD11 homolog protein-like [Typha angustifolia]|uniref:ACD11 homolog protein-like n=1 Tax=Typha angustifolia TaxID=59011 RepID=UPI003C2F7B2A
MGGDSFTAGESGSPLAAVAEAFEELARSFQDCSTDLRLAPFSDACALIPVLFGCIGFAFKFAEMEYVSKVNNLLEASKTYDTLSNILDDDVKHDTARKPESHSQNLCRVRLGLDLIRALFEQFLTANECSLKEAALAAYGQVCAPFHSWATRKAIGAGMYTLPTWEQLLSRLNETDHSVQKEMRRYIDASSLIIQYIDTLFLSRNISLDW